MARLPRASGKDVVRGLERGGFAISHMRGSHYYQRAAGRDPLVVSPVHGNRIVPLGALNDILRQAELSGNDLDALLRA